jgi:hypothetical protein
MVGASRSPYIEYCFIQQPTGRYQWTVEQCRRLIGSARHRYSCIVHDPLAGDSHRRSAGRVDRIANECVANRRIS